MFLTLVRKVALLLSVVGGAYCLPCGAQNVSPSGKADSVPAVPQGISASDNEYPGHALICWDPVSDALRYQVWRADTRDFSQAQLIAVTDEPCWIDDSVYCNITSEPYGGRYAGYSYWIVAENDFGPSDPSEPVQGSAAEELKIADVDLPTGAELSEYPSVCFSDVNRRACRWAVVEKYATSTSHVEFAQTGDALWLKGDDVMTTVELPFEFSFYGRAFTSVCVGSNGCLSFGERRNPFSWIPCDWCNIEKLALC